MLPFLLLLLRCSSVCKEARICRFLPALQAVRFLRVCVNDLQGFRILRISRVPSGCLQRLPSKPASDRKACP